MAYPDRTAWRATFLQTATRRRSSCAWRTGDDPRAAAAPIRRRHRLVVDGAVCSATRRPMVTAATARRAATTSTRASATTSSSAAPAPAPPAPRAGNGRTTAIKPSSGAANGRAASRCSRIATSWSRALDPRIREGRACRMDAGCAFRGYEPTIAGSAGPAAGFAATAVAPGGCGPRRAASSRWISACRFRSLRYAP